MRSLFITICTILMMISSAYADSLPNSIYDEIIPHKSSQSVAMILQTNDMLLRYSKVMSEEEYKLFEAYFKRNFNQNKIKEGTTVAQAIESERRLMGFFKR